MYREIAKLIMYGDLDHSSVLYEMGEIFRDFEEKESSPAKLTQKVYTAVKHL